MQNVLLMIVLIPVIAALLILPLKARAHAITRSIGMLGSLLSALFALAAYIAFQRSDAAYQFVLSVPWATINNAFAGTPLTITFAFAVDGISLPLVMLTGIVSVMAALRSFRVTERVKAHYVWQMLLVSGLYGVFAAADLFTFFFFLEVTLVASFFLILIFGQERREYAAFKFLIYRGIASVFLLLGFVGLAYALANSATTVSASQYMAYGPNFMSLNLLQLLDESVKAPLALGAQTWLFFVFLFAVLIEEAFVPFHTWLIDTHEQSDTSTNMLIGGVLMKVGLYIMLRFVVSMLPLALAAYSEWLAILGVISILYGAFAAIAARDWRRLIAFSGISHMGLVLLAIGSMHALGLQGAVFMLVSSGLLTALLFYTVGAQAERTGTYEIGKLGGLSKSLPVLSGVLLVAALGTVGLPGLSGFISEITLFISSFERFPWVSTLATLGMILAALYLLFAMQRTTFGPAQEATQDGQGIARDASVTEAIPLIVLVAFVIAIGVFPNILGVVVHPTVQALAGRIGG